MAFKANNRNLAWVSWESLAFNRYHRVGKKVKTRKIQIGYSPLVRKVSQGKTLRLFDIPAISSARERWALRVVDLRHEAELSLPEVQNRQL